MREQGNSQVFDVFRRKVSTFLDEEEVCHNDAMDLNYQDDMASRKHSHSLVYAVVYLLVAVLGITTTTALMLRGYHYPARLLTIHILAALILEIGVQIVHHRQLWRAPRNVLIEVGQSAKLPCKTRLAAIGLNVVEAVCLSGSLICEYQAMYHVKSLPALAMLFALQINLLPLIIRKPSWMNFGTGCLGALGIMSIVIFDQHLTRPSLLLSIGGVLLAGSARVLRSWAELLDNAPDSCCHKIMVLLVALPCTLGALMNGEWPIYTPFSIIANAPLFVLSIGSGAVLLRTTVSLFRPYADHDASEETFPRNEQNPAVWAMVISSLIALTTTFFGFQHTVTLWQYAGFATALVAMHLQNSPPPHEPLFTDDEYRLLDSEKSGLNLAWHERRRSLRFISLFCAILLAFPTSIYFTAEVHSTVPPHSLTTAHHLPTNSTLDIVISRHSETSVQLLHQLHPLLHLPALEHRNIRVLVYDTSATHPNAFSVALRAALNSTVELHIEPRPNIGREAGAYLHHMSQNYDRLADHTLFLQAQAHDFQQLLWRLESHFVPETGFLAFSDKQHFCEDCERCWDHSTWSERRDVLEKVIGESCRPFAMTYRGQFLVSKRRIQARGRAHYQDLMRLLSDAQSEVHGQGYIDQPWMPGKSDILDSPRLGFTLERTWGAVMGCGERRLVEECESMPAGWLGGMLGRKMEDLEKCQCLDEG
ncbi:unnamed protein product [Zymoseptoria tritici ST99CH_1A5]|uniref:Uncharacterized protein n=4 Tax=Zymoseptoria tritici TaxID=1047171 RepID=A0A1X7S669_ZYMT9|nr:unnamed protein product [Zymoseptoria tritici ST99CH_3D7]SMR60334.1 unnamed protein product [Zymoseptoria tritici ST99CH_1E4]SMY28791.1 unnamed protein product [Zymoseptoria tritici ST99CH_1A5]